MKQILSSNGNLVGSFDPPFPEEGKPHKMSVLVEVILTTTEPCRALVPSAEDKGELDLVRTEKLEEFRFVGSRSALRALAKTLEELADAADLMQEKFEPLPKE